MLPYDYLILCTGTEFLNEQGTAVEEEKEVIPQHVFSLGSREQALQVMNWVQQILPGDTTGMYSMCPTHSITNSAKCWLCCIVSTANYYNIQYMYMHAIAHGKILQNLNLCWIDTPGCKIIIIRASSG